MSYSNKRNTMQTSAFYGTRTYSTCYLFDSSHLAPMAGNLPADLPRDGAETGIPARGIDLRSCCYPDCIPDLDPMSTATFPQLMPIAVPSNRTAGSPSASRHPPTTRVC